MSALAKTQKSKAETLVQQAENTMAKKSWFASSRATNQEEGAELLTQAANAYKVGGWMDEAGNCYVRAAEVYQKLKDGSTEAAKCFSQAGAAYKKHNPVDAISAYQSAIGILTDAGRLTQAAKLSKEIAELYEGMEDDPSSVSNAIEAYEQAAELFSLEDAKGQAGTCRAKIAELCSAALDPPDLLKAATIYQDLGSNCLDSNLLKYNAKGYFLQAVLCHLAAGDAIAAEQNLDRFEAMDYTMPESREGKFARQLLECVKNYDAEGFATACFEYDRISKLDPWKTSMLVKVKRSIAGGGIEGGDDDEDDVDLT